MKPSISGATMMRAAFFEDVDACSAAGCPGLEVWLTKLESHLRDHGLAETIDYVADKKVTLVAASYQGGLLLSQGDERRSHFAHFRQRLQLCQSMNITTLLIVADFVQRFDASDLGRAVVSLRQAAQWAAGFGVKLALEFRGSDTFCSCLDTAVNLIEHAGEKNLGVCLDAYHFYKGPSKLEDLDRVPRQRLALVQVADVAGVPRELMSDADRVFPGDGDFRLDSIIGKLRAIGYDGWVSLELLNPVIWQTPSTQVAELGMAALTRLLQNAGTT